MVENRPRRAGVVVSRGRMSTAVVVLVPCAVVAAVWGTAALGADPQDAPPRTIHSKWTTNTTSGPPDAQKHHTQTIEEWMDLESWCRYSRNHREITGQEADGGESRFDGTYAMGFIPEKREVRFGRMSPLWVESERRREPYCPIPLRHIIGNSLPELPRVGQEVVAGVLCDVREGDFTPLEELWRSRSREAHLRVWLDPRTDEINRLEYRMESANSRSTQTSTQTYEVLERDQPIPAEWFVTEPPEGYTLVNTKETARRVKFTTGEFAGLSSSGQNVIFTLPDGSVLAAWTLADRRDPEYTRQAFADSLPKLKVGSPLPITVSTVGPMWTCGLEEEVEFAGRHLTYTDDEDGRWEWSLHVPRAALPERPSFRGYAVEVESGRTYATANGYQVRVSASRRGVFGGFPIADAADFDHFVIGAMKEYDTKQPGRTYPTYEEVMQLTQRIRESLED